MFRVTTPQPGYTGASVGVQFVDGVGTCGDGPALRYFRSQGYGVEPVVPAKPADPPAVDEQQPASPAEPERPAPVAPPTRSASKADWVAYAVAHGGSTEADAQAATRDQLAEAYLGPKED